MESNYSWPHHLSSPIINAIVRSEERFDPAIRRHCSDFIRCFIVLTDIAVRATILKNIAASWLAEEFFRAGQVLIFRHTWRPFIRVLIEVPLQLVRAKVSGLRRNGSGA